MARVLLYKVVPMDVREMVAGMPTSQLVTVIAAHAARVEMARHAAGPVPTLEDRQLAECASGELDARVPRPPPP